MKPTIGFIGLGMMGLPMAERILAAGFPLVVYNRTASKTEGLISRGAHRAATCAEVGQASDICITMVSDPKALEEVVFSSDGIDKALIPGKIHIDMSTVSPAIIERLSKHYAEKNVGFLHAPVLGSTPQAADGSLLLFIGGKPTVADRAREVLDVLGKHKWFFPEATQATHLKLICNMFIASMSAPLAQGLVFGAKKGIPPSTLLAVLSHSSLNAPMYQTKGTSISKRQFTPARFLTKHLLKDINLVLEAGKDAGVPLPALEPIRQFYTEAMSMGLGDEDYSAVVKVLEVKAGVEVRE
jgi:3-hydroxyisobutyrate dehydrogenase-like beta-hydroxyacid dehydrogenase